MERFVCLVHYHEIGLKGNNRSVFERKLLDSCCTFAVVEELMEYLELAAR